MGVLKAHQNGVWVPIGGGGSSSSEPEIHVGNSEPTNASVELWLDTGEEGTSATAENIGALPIDGTAADAEKLCGKPPEQYLQPRNLLDNSDFTNPVNQRGYVNGTTIGIGNYFIDRWMVPDWDDFTVTLNDNGILQTPDYLGHISQRLNNLSSYVGQKMTAVIWYNGYEYPYCACGTVVNTDTETYIASAYGDGGQSLEFKCLGYNLWSVEFCVGGPFEVKHIALYPGEYTSSNVPPYAAKGQNVELMECQRYFYVMPNKASFTYPGYSASATTGYFMVTLPVAMRITPTLSVAEIGNVQAFRYNSTAAATAISLYAVDNNAVTFKFTSSGMSAWACVTVRFNTEATLSADL